MQHTDVLIVYDVSTETKAGRRRLRRVAKLCEGHGQRVQNSVFECRLSPAQLEKLRHELKEEIDLQEDSLRIYRLIEPKERYVQVMGKKPEIDLDKPLVV